MKHQVLSDWKLLAHELFFFTSVFVFKLAFPLFQICALIRANCWSTAQLSPGDLVMDEDDADDDDDDVLERKMSKDCQRHCVVIQCHA